MAHKAIRVFLNSLVLVSSQEFGIIIQIKEVKKISKNLNFSSNKMLILKVLKLITLEDKTNIKKVGRLKTLSLIKGKKGKKNCGEGIII